MCQAPVRPGDPLRKLHGVGDGGRQEGKAHRLGHEHNALLPHHTALLVPQVVDLIIDHKRCLQRTQQGLPHWVASEHLLNMKTVCISHAALAFLQRHLLRRVAHDYILIGSQGWEE